MYQRLIAPILKKRGRSVPSYEVLRYNASLVLGNTHVALGDAFAMPQAYKQIGGYHINKETVPLPEVGSFSSNIQNRNFVLGNAEIITTINMRNLRQNKIRLFRLVWLFFTNSKSFISSLPLNFQIFEKQLRLYSIIS